MLNAESDMLTFAIGKQGVQRWGALTVRGNRSSREAKELGANLDGEDLVGGQGTGWGFAGTSGGGHVGVRCHGGGELTL